MDFYTLAVASSVVTLILAAGWLCAGRSMLKRWGIAASSTELMLGRRIGAIYMGLAVIFFLSRDTSPSELRDSLSIGAIVVCGLLAGLGLYEFKANRVGSAILVSVAVELVLLAGYVLLLTQPAHAGAV